MRMFGLLGQSLAHSFSKSYFTEKFELEVLADHAYENFELDAIAGLPALLRSHPHLAGLNVTIPYKQSVVPYLDELSPAAAEIGAVNTIEFRGGRLIGHNTDVVGFELTLKPFLPFLARTASRAPAAILGDGGAAQAVKYVLAKAGLPYLTFKRSPDSGEAALPFGMLGRMQHDGDLRLIINATPVGTYPNTEEMPGIDPAWLSEENVVIDLIYNPAETLLLREARKRGARIANGLAMLHGQAEAAWSIWNSAA